MEETDDTTDASCVEDVIEITATSMDASGMNVSESVCGDSTLNNNVEFSNSEPSGIEDASAERSRLSITLDERERQLLRQAREHSPQCSLPPTEPSDAIEMLTVETTAITNGTHTVEPMAADEAEDEAVDEVEDEVDDELLLRDTSEAQYFQQSLIELGRRLWPSTPQAQNYTKGCLWSPDGTCLLSAVHLDGMHVIELPTDCYTINVEGISAGSDRAVHALPSAVHVKEGGTVYDYAWYPYMNSTDPDTCAWLATRQHEPIHMWDAFTGELRCSYRGYDDVDEVEAAISVAFSTDGKRVLGGYKKSIKVFDTNVPGRDSSCIKVKQAVSCFALTEDNDDTVTVGSWNGYIQHYDLRAPKLGALFTLGGHCGGITWLRYAAGSANNWLLFSGARKDNKLLQWDMRNYKQPLCEYARTVSTNQRIYFDLSPHQRFLATGDTGGVLRVWDLLEPTDEPLEIQLHEDCLNGVNFHPTLPILATTSGQYHFVDTTAAEEQADGSPADEPLERVVDYENSIMFLWLGAHATAESAG